MNKISKILLSILLVIYIFTVTAAFPLSALAEDGPWYNQSYDQWNAKVFDSPDSEIFGERYTFAQVTWIIHSLTAVVMGQAITKCTSTSISDLNSIKDCLEKMSSSPLVYNSPAIFIGGLGDGLITTSPASGVAYVSQTAQNLHLIPVASAQESGAGYGYGQLQPLLPIWTAVRNISYAMLILVFVLFAFMIMFRVKVSPQTIITFQTALPRIAVMAVAVAFSYAIAGFVVDLSHLLVAFVAMLVKSVGSDISSLGTVELYTKMARGTDIFRPDVGGTVVGPLGSLLLIILVVGVLIASVGAGAGYATGGVSFGIGTVILLIFAALVFFIALRLLWLLIRTFVMTIITIIMGPFMIMGGALPGSSLGLGGWLRALISNIIVFPVVLIMVFLAHFLFWKFMPDKFPVSILGSNQTIPIGSVLAGSDLLNPYKIQGATGAGVGSVGFPGFSFPPIAASIFGALGVLLLIPSAGNIVKSLIQGRPFDYGTAIGGMFGAPIATGKGRSAAIIGGIEKRDAAAADAAKETYVPRKGVKIAQGIGWYPKR